MCMCVFELLSFESCATLRTTSWGNKIQALRQRGCQVPVV